jgi:uncharacterized protein YwqG
MNVTELLRSLDLKAADALAAAGRPAAMLRIGECPPELSAGQLGGEPALPPGMPWPAGPKGPLPFLAAVHMDRIPRCAVDADLPTAGTLLFFCDLEPMYLDSHNSAWWAVRYVGPGELTRPGSVDRMPPSLPLRFLVSEATWTVPDYFSLVGQQVVVDKADKDLWFDLCAQVGGRISASVTTGQRRGRIQVGGNPECEQSSVFENVTRDSWPPRTNSTWTEEMREDAKQWRLLAQIWSFPEVDFEVGDLDALSFCIREDDLRNMRFEGAWAVT